MTTTLQTDPRRTARDAFRKPGRPPLEMPVLFQLADLSLQGRVAPPKTLSTPLLALPEAVTVDAALATPEVMAPPAPIAESPATMEPPQAEVPQPAADSLEPPAAEGPKPGIPQVEQQPELVVPQTLAEPSQTESTQISKISDSVAAEPPVATPAVEATAEDTVPAAPTKGKVMATDITPPQESNAPSPRHRTEQRARNRPAAPAKNNNWMGTHGKVIAVGFVFALIATIYMAQNGDEPAPANPDRAATSHEEALSKTPTEAESKVTDAHTAKESVSASEPHQSPTLMEETSPAARTASAEASADLPGSKSDSAIPDSALPTEIADSKSLFPWKEAADERVAAKPEAKEGKLPAISESEESPSVYGPPSSAPQDPVVRQATSEAPEGKAPESYPVTNPGTYRDFEPPPSRTAPAQPRSSPPRAAPASNQPGTPNNVPPTRTSGPRHERTGSGLY